MDELINKIVEYIINDIKENSSEGQMIVDFEDIQDQFADEIENVVFEMVATKLSENEEVADVETNCDGFDVVLFTGYMEKGQE